MILVLDTNIIVSATIANGNEFKLLKKAENKDFILAISHPLLIEFKEVISREKFGYNAQEIDRIVSDVIKISKLFCPEESIDIMKEDPDDNKVLECAVTAKADYIVSGDHHLRDLKEYHAIKIIASKDMLEIFKKI
ncbi:MAG: putative toxin-antitoxin system toxin component, PIN family [Candidatus Altiarchaeales archaeon HGW-Altiarchaeales-2]|nr:MAG: putative toxin-antitoxin system toxin component, PIN family [Candidatus Altiarchaeales archaeon HGW-Altiarchaeales-2]